MRNIKTKTTLSVALGALVMVVLIILFFLIPGLTPTTSSSSSTSNLTSSNVTSSSSSSSVVLTVNGILYLNGGHLDEFETSIEIEEVEVGELINLPTPEEGFFREDYTFIGWYLDADLSILAENISNEEGEYLIEVPNHNFTLYAKWAVNEVELSFVIDEETIMDYTMSVSVLSGVGDLPTPTLEGYYFLGWFLNLEDPTSKVTNDTVIKEDTVLYANFTKLLITTNFKYYISKGEISYLNGGAILADYIGPTDGTPIEIPDTVTYEEVEYPVVGLGEYIFSWIPLTSIVVPDSVKYIYRGAFSGTGLESITLSKNLVTIGEQAFGGTQLTSIDIPASVTTIEKYAFSDLATLQSVSFEEDSQLTIIGDNSFARTGITSLVIPASVLLIQNGAFDSCSELSSVTFEEGSILKEIGDFAFSNNKLSSITVPDSIIHLGLGFLSGSMVTSVNLPHDVVRIDAAAFNGLAYLETLIAEDMPYLLDVGSQFFTDSPFTNNLSTLAQTSGPQLLIWNHILVAAFVPNDGSGLVIPEGVTVIAPYVFENKNLGEVTLPSTLKEISEKAFYWTRLNLLSFPSSLEIIGNNAFNGATFSPSTSLTIPNSVKYLGNTIFANTVNLSSIIFEEGSQITKIPSYFAYFSMNLTSIEFPSPLYSIETYALASTSISEIVLPQSLQLIEEKAFSRLYQPLVEVSIEGEGVFDHYISIAANIFHESNTNLIDDDGNIILGGVLLGNNQSAQLPEGRLTIPEGIIGIANSAFMDNPNIHSVVNDSSVLQWIDDSAFAYISNLTSVDFSGGQLKSIGFGAFANTSLSVINLPATLERIDPVAFNSIQVDYTVNFSDFSQLTSLSPYAFGSRTLQDLAAGNYGTNGCFIVGTTIIGCVQTSPEQTKLVIPDGVTAIADSAFETQTWFTEVELPSTLVSIGDYAFTMTSLTEVSIPASVNYLGYDSFAYSLIETVSFENIEGITRFDMAFSGTPYVENLRKHPVNGWIMDEEYHIVYGLIDDVSEAIVPEGTIIIAEEALSYHYTLQSVVVPASVRIISYKAFANNPLLESVIFEDEGANLKFLGGYLYEYTMVQSFFINSESTIIDPELTLNAPLLQTVYVSNATIKEYVESTLYNPLHIDIVID